MAAGRGPERKDGCAPLPPSPRLQLSADPKPKTFTCQRAASRRARGGRARPFCPSLTWLGRFRGRLGHGWSQTGERWDGDRLPRSRPAVRGGGTSTSNPKARRSGGGGRTRDEERVPGGSSAPGTAPARAALGQSACRRGMRARRSPACSLLGPGSRPGGGAGVGTGRPDRRPRPQRLRERCSREVGWGRGPPRAGGGRGLLGHRA